MISFLYHYIMGIYLGKNYPFNTFLFRPWSRFGDFIDAYKICNIPYLENPKPFENPLSLIIHFPFLQKFISVFTILNLKYAFVLFISIFLFFFFYYSYKNLCNQNNVETYKNLLIFTLMSYPFLFSIDRANFEIYVFIFICLFVYFYKNNRVIISIIFLSFAISMKITPALFLVILLSNKKYREILFTMIIVSVLTITSYLSIDGGFLENVNNHLINLSLYNKIYAIGNEGLYFGNSLYGLIKFLIYLLQEILGSSNKTAENIIIFLFKIYPIFSILIFIALTIYIILIEKVFWKKTALLVFAMNLLPYVSGDYKLLHLYVPLFLFINSVEHENNDLIYTILFSLLLIPKNYYNLQAENLVEANIAVAINPLIMLIFSIIIIYSGLKYKNKTNKLLSNRSLPDFRTFFSKI